MSSTAFENRHIGPSLSETEEMLRFLKVNSLEKLIDQVVPESIRMKGELKLKTGLPEHEALKKMAATVRSNQVFRSLIGLGYSGCVVPGVIQRNILENPGWYTQYTPYQAEISQGRLEALLNYQTMVSDLTGLPIANASLLDEGTAAAEAMTMCFAIKGRDTSKAFFVSSNCHPQTIAIVETRAKPLGIKVIVDDEKKFDFAQPIFAALVQYPNTFGSLEDYSQWITSVHSKDAMAILAADVLALTLFKSPGEMGADIAIGNTQRFGVPLGFGGPHAAYFATKDEYKRLMPGRIVGVSKDAEGRNAIRLALQTREQHIRREKATSNICTAQVLLAVMASMYAVYHGPKGLKTIAERVYGWTHGLAEELKKAGFEIRSGEFFDSIVVKMKESQVDSILNQARAQKFNFRKISKTEIGLSLDESTNIEEIQTLIQIFGGKGSASALRIPAIPKAIARQTAYLQHPVFNRFHSETEMLRYIRRLESKDLSLTTSMIPLGSCTMKLNATSEMQPVSWPEISSLHPFAPTEQTQGYSKMFSELEDMLSEITGFDATSLQPNAGSQGEYSGLLVIREFHEQKGQGYRNICLIPQSAHGTNPATATMAGFQVVVVKCDEAGNVDVADLKVKAEANSKNLAALMITYPSTHGVFEEGIQNICKIIHDNGGQVYMDGANMNAQVGLCRPGDFGPDVCHLNLHKTFCIPHGGGGPGMGPIAVKKNLAPFLPGHPLVKTGGELGIGAISAAPWGSASILPIPYMYILMMGVEGLKRATQVAILNANYVAEKLQAYYPVLYRGKQGRVAHECIVDLRQFKSTTGVEVEDVAKRLMDYGFHAPTISFPVPGTMMIEPTESESKVELDRFCDAMILIRAEISEIESGKADTKNNLLKNAPHTAQSVTQNVWDRPYSRQQAAYPAKALKEHKYWPPVARVDNVYGERNLVCACLPIEEYS